MQEKFGFLKMSVEEFEPWLLQKKIGRTVLTVQQHHTFIPNYGDFTGNNHFELQRAMKNFHVDDNGWMDIGQHLSIFPDGMVVTGRSFEFQPACIKGRNRDAFCIENVGDFHVGKDEMTSEQQESIIRVTAILCKKFGLEVNDQSIVYHHWFNLDTGERNNGTEMNKTCPGTNFFEGNKVSDFEANLKPKIQAHLPAVSDISLQHPVISYAVVTAMRLNVRQGPRHTHPLASDREPIPMGSIVRVFEVAENGWVKISSSSSHWVSGRFTNPVTKGTVRPEFTPARKGPGEQFEIVMNHVKGEVLFFEEEEDGWHRMKMGFDWINEADLLLE